MKRCVNIMIVCIIAIGGTVSGENHAHAQGIERQSTSGPFLAEQLRQSGNNQAYNLRLGPVTLRADAELTTSFNDNTNLVKHGRIADFIVTPTLAIHARWDVSELNTLTLNLGIGYETYISHSQYNNLVLSPDSEASFNFFVGDLAFNVHDSFSYQQDPTQIGQLSNSTRLARFQNDVGIRATWDLSTVILSLDYDHANLWVTQSTYDYLTNQSDTIAPKATFVIDKSIKAGIDLSYSNVRYDKGFENDYQTISAGPFLSAIISRNLSAEAQAGGYFSEYARGGLNGDNEDVSSYYASLGLSHRINDVLTESLTAGREFIPGLTSNFTERVYANYGGTWKASSSLNVGANLWWENLTDSNAAFREKSNRFGAGLNVEDALNDHVTLTFNYQYILKDADPSLLSYQQNVGTLGVRYRF